LTTRSEELMANISELTKQNEALRTTAGQSEMDRTKLSDVDKQLSELKVALADVTTENQTKTMKLASLSATVDSLTHELDASKVMQISATFVYL